MRFVLAITCIVLLAASIPAYPAGKFITRYQADQAVRAFEKASELSFHDADTAEDLSGPEWRHRGWFTIKQNVSSKVSRVWQVDATTGEVLASFYGDAVPDSASEEPAGELTKEECLQIAYQFVLARYAQFDKANFVLDEQADSESWTGCGWSFSWHQEAEYDAVTPNFVRVVVNPQDGEIESYVARRFPTPQVAAPQLTAQEAITVAGLSEHADTAKVVLIADPDRTYWRVNASGLDGHGVSRVCVAEVDAQNGVLTAKYDASMPSMSMPRTMVAGIKQSANLSRPAKPAVISARAALLKLGYTIFWEPKKRQLRAIRDGSQVVLTIGSKSVVVGDKRVELSASPRLVKDRTLVLSTLMDMIAK